jgi:hypothetical protein
MSATRSKRPRIQLDPDAYQHLCRQVLRRDGWRCQACGNRGNLELHHLKFRKSLGT